MACLVVGFGSFAQQETSIKTTKENLTVEQRQDMKLQKMEKELALTPNQVFEVKELMSKTQSEITEKREARKAQAKEKIAFKRSEMEKILTTDQLKKWNEGMTKRKEKMNERRNERKSKR
jgi:Spy/CpxP family protein refolding chaperone